MQQLRTLSTAAKNTAFSRFNDPGTRAPSRSEFVRQNPLCLSSGYTETVLMDFFDRFQNFQLHFTCFVLVLHFTQYIFVKAQADTLFSLNVLSCSRDIFMVQNGFPETKHFWQHRWNLRRLAMRPSSKQQLRRRCGWGGRVACTDVITFRCALKGHAY